METIGLGQSIVITIFSMLVVFLVLMGISFLIDLLRLVVERMEDKGKGMREEVSDLEEEPRTVPENLAGDEELVAVISAALAASMGVDLPEINIKSIKRVDHSWKSAARNEQVFKNI